MKDEKSKEEKQELAALYALGALCQHEAQVFESHLQDGDSQTVADLESFEKVVEALGYATSAVEPPAYLLDVLTARLLREPQIPGQIVGFPNRRPISTQLVEISQPTIQPQAPQAYQNVAAFPVAKQQRKSSAAIVIPWAVAATLLIAAIVGFWQWRKATTSMNSQIADLKKETDLLKRKLNDENEKVFELARISQALRSPNARVIELAGQEAAPTSKASIFWDTSGNQWVVSADLPPAPEGKVYQLWFITSEGAVSAGLMKSNERGHAFTVVDLPKNLGNLTASGITLEPAGGSAQPTKPIYALGTVTG